MTIVPAKLFASTAGAVGDATVTAADFPLKRGDSGDAVAVLQSIIKSLSCNQTQFKDIDLGPFGPDYDGDGEPDGIDGEFGPVTEEAVAKGHALPVLTLILAEV